MDSQLLDSLNTIQTPEGVEIHLRLAGVWPRSIAWLLDSLIRAVAYIGLSFAFDAMGDMGSGMLLISIFLIEWFYPVFFEVLNKGMTPGKKWLNIQVLNSDGTPVGWSPSLLRNILRTVDFLPMMYGIGFFTMLMNNRFQRLGDLAADTVVVYLNNYIQNEEIPSHQPVKLAYDLNLKEQQAIIRFAERYNQLSDERLNELAEILNIMDPVNEKMTKDQLLGIANGLLGRS